MHHLRLIYRGLSAREIHSIPSSLRSALIRGDDCSKLGTLNTSVEEYIGSIEAVYAQLSAPLSLTQEDLTSLDDLSTISRSMAEESVR
ncbi:MAG: hypothetical protein ACP5D3_04345, partial [Sulfurovum sp.]